MISYSQKWPGFFSSRRKFFTAAVLKQVIDQAREDSSQFGHLAAFRTLINNPTEFSLKQEGQFYKVAPETVKRLDFPRKLSLTYQKQIDTFLECCFMVRRPFLEIVHCMKLMHPDKPINRLVVYGKKGTGKSITLCQLLHCGFVDKWVLLHVPSVLNWNRNFQEISMSFWKPGRIDLPLESAEWLQDFKKLNSHLLEEISDLKTTKNYEWSKRDATSEGVSLMEVVENGINRVRYASDCIGVLLKELKHYASEKRIKILATIDEANALFHSTLIKREDKTYAPATDVSLNRHFANLLLNNWAFELLDPIIPIETTNYNQKEMISCLDYYIDRNWITNPEVFVFRFTDANENVGLDVSPELEETYLFRLPRAYNYADYVWPGILISPERLQLMKSFEFKPNDILIASYPKSGTTWASEIVSLIVHGGDIDAVKVTPLHDRVPWLEMDNGFVWVRFFWLYQLFAKLVGLRDEDVQKKEDKEEKPRIFFTHLPLELLPKQALDGVCRIIYVSRNPKDNAVSFFHFHQMARFLGLQKTTWEEFFPLYTVGKIYCGSWFEHVLSFWGLSKVNSKVLFLKYEDMKKDLYKEVEKISDFLDVKLDNETLKKVANHCSFDTMKGNRMANREGVWLFNQSVSKFMRKGVVGDWKNYFTVKQNEIFDQVYKERMKDTDLQYIFELD